MQYDSNNDVFSNGSIDNVLESKNNNIGYREILFIKLLIVFIQEMNIEREINFYIFS